MVRLGKKWCITRFKEWLVANYWLILLIVCVAILVYLKYRLEISWYVFVTVTSGIDSIAYMRLWRRRVENGEDGSRISS